MILKNNTTTGSSRNSAENHLHRLGWSPFFQKQLEDMEHTSPPARVTGARKGRFIVNLGDKELLVTVAGSLIHEFTAPYPAVGDWVVIRDTVISSILDRKSVLTRKASGGKTRRSGEASSRDQVIAANLDKAFIVCGIDRDYNLRRIERYLTMVYSCGITPEIVLTKADLHQNPERYVHEAASVALGVPVHLVSAEDSLSSLRSALCHGETAALIGSSGAGKSTLINRLYGEDIQATNTVSSSHGKGRHTTTSRDLIVLPSDGIVIDNPGIREIGLAADCPAAESTFPEIEVLAGLCRFQDCSHTHEPGCQVLFAVSTGDLDHSRLESYQKLRRELDYLSQRHSKSAARLEKEHWKGVSQKIKHMKKRK